MESLGLVVLIIFALGFDFTNGFNDAANAIAMPISTRAMPPRVALGLAAVFNLRRRAGFDRRGQHRGQHHHHPG